MMNLIFILVSLLSTLSAYAINFLPMPTTSHRSEVVEKAQYVLSYNEEHEVANWVLTTLKPSMMKNCTSRSNSFRSDPNISTGSATLQDYKNSGYDRGHLIPAGDMKMSATAMSETFFLSNMTPQTGNFNQGQWQELESLVRAWIMKGTTTTIISGPILHKKLPKIGPTGVSVPKFHYKIIYQVKGKLSKMIAFLMEDKTPYGSLEAYSVSVDEIEDMTGWDFFAELDNDIEEDLESHVRSQEWDFNSTFQYLPCTTSY
jgi:endonuclease G